MYQLPYLGPSAELFGGSLARHLAARALRRLSGLLARMALVVAGPVVRSVEREPMLEFHGEAGAPEGALFVDGVLIGTLVGVKRL